jgi:hypothetical protein
MKFKLNAAVAALALVALAGAAQANMKQAQTGNGSMMLVAVDSVGTPIGLTVDLGYVIKDFDRNLGTLTAANTSISWDLAANTRTVNGVTTSTGFSWSGALAEFNAVAQASDTRWAVLGGDNVTGGELPGRSFMATGAPTLAQMVAMNSSGAVPGAMGVFNNFVSASNNLGTQTALANTIGANTSSSGQSYLLNSSGMRTNYGTFNTWNYLVANGATSNFHQVQQITANPEVYQLGSVLTPDATFQDPTNAAIWSFDLGTATLTYTVGPIPEPGTYAMFLAGLGAVGFMMRRRSAAR